MIDLATFAILSLEHWQVIGVIITGAIGYAYGLYRMVSTSVDGKMQGCNVMHKNKVDAIADETKQIRENYLQRFEEVKVEIRETKKDVLERIDLILELLRMQSK